MKRHAKHIVLWTASLLLPMSASGHAMDFTGAAGDGESLMAASLLLLVFSSRKGMQDLQDG